MSHEITVSRVQKFKSDVIFLAQKRLSIKPFIQLQEHVVGNSTFFERVGSSDMVDVSTRHAASPQRDTPHSRRRVNLITSDWGDLIDKADQRRVKIDILSAYTQTAAWAVNRRFNKHVIDAATGNALSDETGSTTVALPASQKVGVQVGGGGSDVGLNMDKLLRAKEIFDANYPDDAEEQGVQRIILLHSRQLNRDLMPDDKIGSTDFNAMRALSRGELKEYLGFRFILTNQLNTDANSDRQVIAMRANAVGLGIGEEMDLEVAKDPAFRFSTRVFAESDMGAGRVEEEGVVEIACDET